MPPHSKLASLAPALLLAWPLLVSPACMASKRKPGAVAAAPEASDRLSARELAASVRAVIDPRADPCEDFYRYACGRWLDTTRIPSDQPAWDRGFSVIEEGNYAVLRDILEQAANAGGDADLGKIGEFYASCMDEAAVERTGADPLNPFLAEIASVRDAASFMSASGKLASVGAPVLFDLAVDADFKNPNISIAHFSQGGLGLPDREYYLADDDKSKTLRGDYLAHVGRMLELSGEPRAEAARHARMVLDFETGLAEASIPREELRDPEKNYHKIDLDGLARLTPKLSWNAFLTAAGADAVTQINVAVPGFFEGMGRGVAGADAETLRAYLRWHLVHSLGHALPKAFVDEGFGFYEAKLSGQKEIKPRWKRCVARTDEALGEILGRYYVRRRFPGDSKAVALGMIEGIESALRANLSRVDWMDEPTRARASEKLDAITNKIGYPDKWRDYSALRIRRGDYFGNEVAAANFEFRRQTSKVGRPVDRTEWGMTPPAVNAYYNPLVNEMVFPAGILQPPFFHRDFPAPMNYGAMGMVMGHELTHGFDDEGRKFDAGGRLTEWWDPAVARKFEQRAQCVVDLYGSYEPLPGLHLNGKLTLGENIADLGGVKEAYFAYRSWVGEHGDSPPFEGLTNDQLFFVGFAQSWCSLYTPEMERLLAKINSHSPPRFRVNGSLSNFPVFADAFACRAGSPMRPEKICEVW